MDLMQKFSVDLEKEKEGVWFPIGADAEIKVARWNNPDFRKVLGVLRAPYNNAGTLDDETLVSTLIEAMSVAILVNWRGTIEVNGVDLGEYDANKALELLTTPELKDFVELVTKFANDLDAFRTQRVQIDVGKFETTFDGFDNGETARDGSTA